MPIVSHADINCEVRSDALTRQLYATDASIYEVMPAAVAFPRSTADCSALLTMAAAKNLAVTARGAGTGLAGGALGSGLVVDLARQGRWITDLDLEAGTVRVGPGVVLDQLNAYLRPHGVWFGPDVATSSRATLGGMIANNSSGAHAPVYGTTADHLARLEVVLADGTVAIVGPEESDLPALKSAADRVVEQVADQIHERLPPGLVKRWPGYGLDRYLKSGSDLTQLVSGSEGTLALITGATLQVVPLPRTRGLAVVFFASVGEALEAAVEVADLGPAAVEHIDRQVLDQTREHAAFRAARDLLDLDSKPAEALLLVEVFDQSEDHLRELERRGLGQRTMVCADEQQRQLVWSIRKAGLNLLTSRLGPEKPAACIEDVCVRPDQLPAYVSQLQRIMDDLGLVASYYGHAASGELHVRPVLDLRTEHGVEHLRRVSDAVSDLCRSFDGSLAAEHGVGMARTEYLAAHLGGELVEATKNIKQLFDPDSRFNPGKIVDTGRYRIDQDLRQGTGTRIELPFRELLTFGDRHEGFVANLEQCNGCGGCRKDQVTMCPTFISTGDEAESTRGRANIIRAAFENHEVNGPVVSAEIMEVLEDCLSCKACRSECPSGVDLASLKAQLLSASHQRHGPSLFDRLVGAADLLGRLGSMAPRLANAALSSKVVRRLLESLLGISADRALPAYARQRFDRWFVGRQSSAREPARRLLLWDDTWVRYHEPAVGVAAVEVLEALGFAVELVADRRCCGRPAFSRGLVDAAAAAGRHNLQLLHQVGDDTAIVFLEPSCYAMFVDEYIALGLDHAEEVAKRVVLFEDLVLQEVLERPDALELKHQERHLAVHVHCHTKALAETASGQQLLKHLPGSEVETLSTGCCGMAGAFGIQAKKQELSMAVAEPLVDAIDALQPGTDLVASGTSCRHQIRHLTARKPLHVAEAIARDLQRN